MYMFVLIFDLQQRRRLYVSFEQSGHPFKIYMNNNNVHFTSMLALKPDPIIENSTVGYEFCELCRVSNAVKLERKNCPRARNLPILHKIQQ